MQTWEEIEKNLKVQDAGLVVGTGYFARLRKYGEKGWSAFSIARYAPKGVNIPSLPMFFPSADLLREYKAGLVDKDRYIERYYIENLDRLNPADVLDELLAYGKPVLICYEKASDFCHRHIISHWLSSAAGVNCGEIAL